jgi:myo-inositol-1-phosphate synthase
MDALERFHHPLRTGMSGRRVGIWLIGAFGGVGTTVALGLAALRRGLTDETSLITALPLFTTCDLDHVDAFEIGGHEIREANFHDQARSLHERANVFAPALIDECRHELERWSKNIRPGSAVNSGAAISQLAQWPEAMLTVRTGRQLIERVQDDIKRFRDQLRLDQVVVIHVASTEPPFELMDDHRSMERLEATLEQSEGLLPSSALYAWAALDLGLPYVNFTPSLGASLPALEELTIARSAAIAGKDGKTGETLLKSVLAPMFALRNWEVLSWVGHNIFGNSDGWILGNPENKAAKLRSKDQVIARILGYQPQTHVSIEYVRSLDDWKTAWDFIHFRGFLGTKMSLQFTWQGCDSLLAAPLVIDLARLALLSQRRGEVGVLKHLACFFKDPMGVQEHDFFKQFALLEEYVKGQKSGTHSDHAVGL